MGISQTLAIIIFFVVAGTFSVSMSIFGDLYFITRLFLQTIAIIIYVVVFVLWSSIDKEVEVLQEVKKNALMQNEQREKEREKIMQRINNIKSIDIQEDKDAVNYKRFNSRIKI